MDTHLTSTLAEGHRVGYPIVVVVVVAVVEYRLYSGLSMVSRPIGIEHDQMWWISSVVIE